MAPQRLSSARELGFSWSTFNPGAWCMEFGLMWRYGSKASPAAAAFARLLKRDRPLTR